MNKRWIKLLRIVVFAVGISAALALPAGNIASTIIKSNYNQKIDNLRSSFSHIIRSYATFGLGKETDNVINGFLSSIPVDMQSNIVIVDPAGTIQYKLNDNYLHAISNKISMAWNDYSVVTIDQASESHWYRMDWIGGWDTETRPEAGGIDSFGMNDHSADKLTDMLDSYYLVEGPEAVITIYGFGSDSKDIGNDYRFCVLWIRDAYANDSTLVQTFYIENVTTPAGILLLMLFWLLAPIYIFLDARHRKIQPLPWALLVLVTNVVGMIVYWIVQSQNGKAEPALAGPVCPACGKAVQKEHLYCPWCAEPLHKNCKGCGKPLEKDWVACPWCGKPME